MLNNLISIFCKKNSCSSRNRYLPSALFFAFMIITSGGSKAATTIIPVAIVTCATCQNQTELEAAATSYANTWIGKTPPGYAGVISPPNPGLNDCGYGQSGATTLFVISTALPLSGTFYACYVAGPHGVGRLSTVAISAATTAQAIAADNVVLHRSVPEGAITLPPTLTWLTADAVELPEAYVQGAEILTSTGTSWWHGLQSLPGIPQVTYGIFLNTQTNQTFKIYAGDTITVTDKDGYSAQVQWNPAASPTWIYVSGSLRDPKGNPVPNSADNLPPGPSPSTPGTTPQPVGPVDISLPGGPTQIVIPNYGDTTPGGSVTVGPLLPPTPPPDPPAPTAGCSNPDCTAPS